MFFVSAYMCVTAPKSSSSRTNDEDKMFEKMALISTGQLKRPLLLTQNELEMVLISTISAFFLSFLSSSFHADEGLNS